MSRRSPRLAALLLSAALLSACTSAPSINSTVHADTSKDSTIENAPMTEGSTVLDTITVHGGVRLDIECLSTVYASPDRVWGNGTNYPTVIELQHSGDENGTLLATFELADSGLTGKPTRFRIYQSTDGGNGWSECSQVTETLDNTLEACWNPCLFELPDQLGKMPAGTLLLAGVSIDPGQSVKSQISLWRSFDCGKSWEQFAVIAIGGGVESGGVWEPYLVYENGTLYCFYSDETLTGHDQAIVYRTSTDGITFSQPYPAVAADNPAWRPGMISLTRMGNGQYFILYELFGDWDGCPIYYKTADSLTDWDPSDVGTQLSGEGGYYIGSAPQCIWVPDGGENGTLLVSAVYGAEVPNKLLVSFDYGATFYAIENPLPYSDGRGGYSASFFLCGDGSIVYVNNVDGSGERSRIAFARLRIR